MCPDKAPTDGGVIVAPASPPRSRELPAATVLPVKFNDLSTPHDIIEPAATARLATEVVLECTDIAADGVPAQLIGFVIVCVVPAANVTSIGPLGVKLAKLFDPDMVKVPPFVRPFTDTAP